MPTKPVEESESDDWQWANSNDDDDNDDVDECGSGRRAERCRRLAEGGLAWFGESNRRNVFVHDKHKGTYG